MSLLLIGAPAQAAAPSVIGSFGPGGLSSGAFGDPRGVAVDQSTGDVYVYDTEHNKLFVYKFNTAGEAQDFSALGTNVIEGAGEAYGEFAQVAIDGASGDIYVTEGEQVTIYGEEGEPLGELNSGVEAEGGHWGFPCGVAVDPAGNVYVALYEGYVNKYAASGNPVDNSDYESALSGLVEPCDIAADSAGDVYVAGYEGGVTKYEASEFNTEEKPPLFSAEVDSQGTSVAVGSSSGGEVYIDEGSDIAVYSSSGARVESFGELSGSFGVAVNDSSGDVYFTDPTEAEGEGEVVIYGVPLSGPPTVASVSSRDLTATETELQAQIDPHGLATTYVFQYATAPISGVVSCTGASASCTEVPVPPGQIAAGFAAQSVSVTAKGLQPGTTYYYRVLASNEDGKSEGAKTFKTFTTLPTAVTGLPDDRAWEMVSPPNKNGAEPAAMASEATIQASVDGDAISYAADGPMPTEAQPEGNRPPEYSQILSTRGAQGWASQDITTANNQGLGQSAGYFPEYRLFSSDLALAIVQPFGGTTGSGSLEEPPLSPPLSSAEAGHQEKTIYLRDDAPEELLAPEASEAGSYEAAKHNGEAMGNPGFLALVTEANAPGGEPFGDPVGSDDRSEGVEFLGATPELSHVVFDSARAAPGLYEWDSDNEVQPVSVLPGEPSTSQGYLGSYEGHIRRHAISDDGALVVWTHAEGSEYHLYVRDTQTRETLQLDAVHGGSGTGNPEAVFQTASADGSKVFFTDEQQLTAGSHAANEKPDLYVFELSGGTDPRSPLSGTLTDLTPEGEGGESADVDPQVVNKEGNEEGSGSVLGASEDGSYVYFVAEGALAAGATSGADNLYVRRYDGTQWTPTRFIATLSAEDSPDWDAGHSNNLGFMTSRVSPNGEYLAFMSDRSLTGYDNEDVTSNTPGEKLDEEVFLYNAGGERLVCASCDPSGARPTGVYDEGAGPGNTEGSGLLVDRLQIWTPGKATDPDHWLAGSVPGWTPENGSSFAGYQSRYLSNSGRLFFDSPADLVPAATSAKEMVYEYEPNQVGSCAAEAGCVGLISSPTAEHEAAFLDASENGDDVFFLSAEKLVPQDIDSNFDVYDAHVCEPSSPCLSASESSSSPPCEETPALPCKGPASFTPAFTAPESTTSSGSGNLPPPSKPVVTPKAKPLTRVQKLAKALKHCGREHKHSKKKRAICEKQARKRYGPKQNAEKHKAGKSSSGDGRRG